MSEQPFDDDALELVGRAKLLMREALVLLDRAAAHHSAALLDNAIAILPGEPAEGAERITTTKIATH